MGRKSTKITNKGKTINHPKGFLNRGLTFDKQVFPVFKATQAGATTWGFVEKLNKANRTANKVFDLIKVLEATKEEGGDLKQAYIAFYSDLFKEDVPQEVIETAYTLANNEDAKKFITDSIVPFADFSDVVRGTAVPATESKEQDIVNKLAALDISGDSDTGVDVPPSSPPGSKKKLRGRSRTRSPPRSQRQRSPGDSQGPVPAAAPAPGKKKVKR